MVKVVSRAAYDVYVYPEVGNRHHLPHCHVRWSGNDVSVALPTLMEIAGGPLPPAARELLIEYLEVIYAKWAELNPERETN